MKLTNLLPVGLLALSFFYFGCGSSKPLTNLPTSRESTCMENISGKDYKYLASRQTRIMQRQIFRLEWLHELLGYYFIQPKDSALTPE